MLASRELIIFNYFNTKIQHFKKSVILRSAFKNAGWSGISYLFAPLLHLAATPYLINKLGTEIYGIWMLINSIIAVSGIASLGLGTATVKYVSQYQAREDKSEVINVIRTTMSLYMILGTTAAILISLSAPFIADHIFRIQPSHRLLLIHSIQIACIALVMRFAYGVVEAVAQGHHRYDFGAQFTIIISILNIVSACIVVSLDGGLKGILLCQILVIFSGFIGLTCRVSHHIRSWAWLLPGIQVATLKKVGGYAFWSWLQTIGSMMASQGDKVIIGAILGPTQLTYYTVCQQILQVGQGFVSKALSFIFPMASSLRELNDLNRLRRLFKHGMTMAIAISCGYCVPLFLFPDILLTLWLGPEISAQASPLMSILALSTAIMTTSTVPFFYLNGSGYARLNALSAFGSGGSIALGSYFLIPVFGLLGAAYARLCNLPISLINRTILQRKVLGNRNPFAGFIGFDIIIIMFLISCLIRNYLPTFETVSRSSFLKYLSILGLTGVISFILAFALSRFIVNIYFKPLDT